MERAQYMRSSERVATLLASLETLSRGFMLGFGISFIYETLLLNRDFYKAEEDLTPRVKRATLMCEGNRILSPNLKEIKAVISSEPTHPPEIESRPPLVRYG